MIQGIKQAGSNNPVFMLDEIDKVGADFRGDPSAALLEVLDPEQNHAFSDHYLNLPFDLSNVLFICTANMLDPIPPALADRMEVIDSRVTPTRRSWRSPANLIPRQLEDNGISAKYLEISNDAVLRIVAEYTKEAGLQEPRNERSPLFAERSHGRLRKKRRTLRALRAPTFIPF